MDSITLALRAIPGGNAAIKRLARANGCGHDPVYTCSAFAGLLDLVDESNWAAMSQSSVCPRDGDEPAQVEHYGE